MPAAPSWSCATPTRTLDEALAEVRPTRVDVVKLDIEMHECAALAGGASLFERYSPRFLTVETAYGNTSRCVRRTAHRYGYRMQPSPTAGHGNTELRKIPSSAA